MPGRLSERGGINGRISMTLTDLETLHQDRLSLSQTLNGSSKSLHASQIQVYRITWLRPRPLPSWFPLVPWGVFRR